MFSLCHSERSEESFSSSNIGATLAVASTLDEEKDVHSPSRWLIHRHKLDITLISAGGNIGLNTIDIQRSHFPARAGNT